MQGTMLTLWPRHIWSMRWVSTTSEVMDGYAPRGVTAEYSQPFHGHGQKVNTIVGTSTAEVNGIDNIHSQYRYLYWLCTGFSHSEHIHGHLSSWIVSQFITLNLWLIFSIMLAFPFSFCHLIVQTWIQPKSTSVMSKFTYASTTLSFNWFAIQLQ